uniref:RHO family interacting cell polarization regulator 1 n=1 Tax=Cyprinus carpio TaxID=7962 RepID=A0A8C2AN29_CYPCA
LYYVLFSVEHKISPSKAASTMSLSVRPRRRVVGRSITRSQSFAGVNSYDKSYRNLSVFSPSACVRKTPSRASRMFTLSTKSPPPKVPQPERLDEVYEALKRGLQSYLQVHQMELDSLNRQMKESKRNSRLGFLYELDKQVKVIERFMRRLEFHLSKIDELYEAYCMQRRLRDGADKMVKAYTVSPGSREARESLSEANKSFKEYTENMCMLESELENQLGEFHVKMKGLAGFARLCAGDQYEIFMKYGRQRWKLRGRIEINGKQVWDTEDMVFLPLITEFLSIKVVFIWQYSYIYIFPFDKDDQSSSASTVNKAPTANKRFSTYNQSPPDTPSLREQAFHVSLSMQYMYSFDCPVLLNPNPLSLEYIQRLPKSALRYNEAPCPKIHSNAESHCSLLSLLKLACCLLTVTVDFIVEYEMMAFHMTPSQLQQKNLEGLFYKVSVRQDLCNFKGFFFFFFKCVYLQVRSRSRSSSVSLTVETALGSFDFLNTSDLEEEEEEDGERHSVTDSAEERPAAVESSGEDEGCEARCWDTPSGPLSTGCPTLDHTLLVHLKNCSSQLLRLGTFGPLRCGEMYALDRLLREARVLELIRWVVKDSRGEVMQPEEVVPQLDQCQGAVLLWRQCTDGCSIYSTSTEAFLQALSDTYASRLPERGAGFTDTVFLHLLERILERKLPRRAEGASKETLTLFQFWSYLEAEGVNDLDTHIPELAEEVLLVQCLQSGDQDVLVKSLKKPPECSLKREGLRAVSLLLRDPRGKVCSAASSLLRSLADQTRHRERALVSCLELLEDESVETRVCGCKSLACLKATESIEQLVYLCRTDKEDVRDAAKQALLVLGEEGKMAHRHLESSQDGMSRLFVPGSMASTAF